MNHDAEFLVKRRKKKKTAGPHVSRTWSGGFYMKLLKVVARHIFGDRNTQTKTEIRPYSGDFKGFSAGSDMEL